MLTLAACSGNGDPESEAGTPRSTVDDGNFRTSILDDPGSLDPHLTVLALTRWVTSFMYDSLISIDESGDVIPYLAESWEVEADSVTYTLTDGVTCSDGSPLTASDVAANFEFISDIENESPALGAFVPVGTSATVDDDAGTITVSTEQPEPFLLHGTGLVQIVCAAGLDDRSMLEAGSAGTGMFVLDEARPGERYTFDRRDDYAWGPDGGTAADPGTPASASLHVISSESTAANMFLAGDLDAVAVEGADTDRIRASGAGVYETHSLAGLLWFNQQEGRPWADPAVRSALAQAADFESVATVTTGGEGGLAESVAGDPRVCTEDIVSGSLPVHDVEAAAATFERAGWEVGADGVRTRDGESLELLLLYFADNTEAISGAELLGQQWEQAGVGVTLRAITDTQVGEILFGTGAWDAVLATINIRFPAQLTPYTSGAVPPDGLNFAHIANDEYDAAVAQAAELPAEEGCEFWEAAERALVSNVDLVPFAAATSPVFVDGAEFRLLSGAPSPPTVRLYE